MHTRHSHRAPTTSRVLRARTGATFGGAAALAAGLLAGILAMAPAASADPPHGGGNGRGWNCPKGGQGPCVHPTTSTTTRSGGTGLSQAAAQR